LLIKFPVENTRPICHCDKPIREHVWSNSYISCYVRQLLHEFHSWYVVWISKSSTSIC